MLLKSSMFGGTNDAVAMVQPEGPIQFCEERSSPRAGRPLAHSRCPARRQLERRVRAAPRCELGVGTTITVTFPIQQDEPFA